MDKDADGTNPRSTAFMDGYRRAAVSLGNLQDVYKLVDDIRTALQEYCLENPQAARASQYQRHAQAGKTSKGALSQIGQSRATGGTLIGSDTLRNFLTWCYKIFTLSTVASLAKPFVSKPHPLVVRGANTCLDFGDPELCNLLCEWATVFREKLLIPAAYESQLLFHILGTTTKEIDTASWEVVEEEQQPDEDHIETRTTRNAEARRTALDANRTEAARHAAALAMMVAHKKSLADEAKSKKRIHKANERAKAAAKKLRTHTETQKPAADVPAASVAPLPSPATADAANNMVGLSLNPSNTTGIK
jgi:hypothetical protein